MLTLTCLSLSTTESSFPFEVQLRANHLQKALIGYYNKESIMIGLTCALIFNTCNKKTIVPPGYLLAMGAHLN